MATAVPYLEKQESQYSISTLDSIDDQSIIDAIVNKVWKYEEVLDLLKTQLAILPGSRDKNGHPVMVMHSTSDSQLYHVSNVGRIISYLSQIPSETVRGQGFTVLLDMRQGTWSMMKKALEALSLTFVEHIHQVIVMKPKSLWQRGRTSMNFNLKKSKYKYKCILLEHSVDVFNYISNEHVPVAQNGDLIYDHSQWMQAQQTIENFTLDLLSRKEEYDNLQDLLDKYEEATSLEEARAAVKNHVSLFEKIDKSGLEAFLATVIQTVSQLRPTTTNPDFEAAFINIDELCRSLQIQHLNVKELWQRKGDALDHTLQFRVFETDSATHILWLQDQARYLSHELTKTGYDVRSAHICKQHVEDYHTKINDRHKEINRVIEVGQRLLALNHPSAQLITNQIEEISVNWEKLTDYVEERVAVMTLSVAFHEKEDKFLQQTESWMDRCTSIIIPPNISSTNKAIDDHKQLYDLISNLYTLAKQDGHSLIEKLRRPVGESSVPVEFIQASRHIKEELESLYDEKNMIHEQWKIRQEHLTKTLNFLIFQKESTKLFTWISDVGNVFLLKNTSIGVDTTTADVLLKSHDTFESSIEPVYSQFNNLKLKAQSLSANKECRLEELEKEVNDLETAVNNFATRLDDRRDVLVSAIQCFKATDNFFKEAASLTVIIPIVRFEGAVNELEERLLRYRTHYGIINNIATTTLQLWNSIQRKIETSISLGEGANCSLNYSSSVRTVEENIKQVDKEQERIKRISHSREKRWELSLNRHSFINDADDYLLQLESWMNEEHSDLADNLDDAETQLGTFKRQYTQHLEKQNELIEEGQAINSQILVLDGEMFNIHNPLEGHAAIDAAIYNIKEAQTNMTNEAGTHLKLLEECTQYYFLQHQSQKLTTTLNQLSQSLSQSEACLKLEDVNKMEQNVKQIEDNLLVVTQDVEQFSISVAECIQKDHYQSASLNILDRTVYKKLKFLCDSLSEKQRVIQSSIDFFSNYEKLQSTMEYCQVQFSSRETGQSLNDINTQQESLKELKESLMETASTVKSQADQLKNVLGGTEQIPTNEETNTDNGPRLLVAPKRIKSDKPSAGTAPQHSTSVIDDLISKMDIRVSRLNRLWDTRLTRLEQSKQVIEFESEVPEVLKWLDEVGATFSHHRKEYGRSLEDVQQLLKEHDTFYQSIVMPMFQKVKELRNKMAAFEESGHYELNRIRSIGNHLEQQWLKFDTEIQTRLSNLKLSQSFQENLFQGSNWCLQSEQFYHSLTEKINHCDKSEEASSLSAELSIYLSVTKVEQLDRVSKIQQISGFLHSNVLSEMATNLDQNTQQILKDFEVIQHDLDTLYTKLSNIEKEKDREMRLLKQKARVVEELIATEEVYVQDLKLVVETYKPRFVSDFLPESLKGKEAVVFGNIQWIAEFHTEVLWPQIQAANSDADTIAQIFVNNVDVMTDLYVPYCQNKTNSEELLASHRTYLSRVSSLFGTDIPLSSLLIKPIQRITKYPLLLMDCLKYTQQLGQPTQALELAVQAVEEIPVQTNNAIHLSLLKSEEGLKWHKYGELLYQGALLVSEPRLLITSEKERQIFLFENTVVFARRIDLGQAKFTYEYKFRIPLTAGIQVLEFIEGEPFKFAFFTSDHRMHLKASTLDVKQKWLKYLKIAIQKHVDEEENKLRSLSMSSARLRSNAVLTGDAVARDLTAKQQSSSPFLPRRPSSPFSKTRINLSASPPPVAFERYRVTEDYIPLKEDHHGLSLKKNQIVEVMEQLDTGRWFIQATSITGQVEHGWVHSSLLEPVLPTVPSPEPSPEPPSTDDTTVTRRRRYTDNFDSPKDTARHQVISTLKKVTLGEGPLTTTTTTAAQSPVSHKRVLLKMAVVDESHNDELITHERQSSYEHSLSTSEEINSQDGNNEQKKLKRKLGVRRRLSSRSNQSSETSETPDKSSSDEEDVDQHFLSPVVPLPSTTVVSPEDKLKKEKAEEKIRYIMAELYETEKEYVQKLDKLVNGFLNHIQNSSNLPDILQGKEWMIFGNVAAIFEFHNLTFQDMLEKAKNSLEAIAQCFLDKRSDFKMYVTYCENKPKSESFIWTYTHQGGTFFKEIQSKLGLREDIASFLIKPVQRITKYQLLLKDLLKSSQKAGQKVPLLEEAVQLMQDVPKQANDAMALSMIVGYHGNIHANGQIVLQDEFTVYERARWAVGAKRHVFLLDLMMIITKEKDNDGLYVFKDSLKVHNMTLTEKQADSPCRFAIGTGQIGVWDKYYILEASTSERKQEWIRTIKEILNQQFEMLKALKQPNIRTRSSTVDYAAGVTQGRESTSSKDIITTQQSVFHDMSDSSLDENSEDEEQDTVPLPTTPSISVHHELSAKSSSSSTKGNLYIAGEDCPAPVQGQYIFSLKKGQIYDVVNSTGDWWLAKMIQDVSGSNISVGTEGWVPSTFMELFTGELDKPPQIKFSKEKTQPSRNPQYSTLPAKLNDTNSPQTRNRSSLFPGFSFKSDSKKKGGKQKVKSPTVIVPKFSVSLSNESVICGHAMEFTCQLSEEYPEQKITWFHNNCPIGRSMAAHITGKVCSLKLDNAVPEDEGLYTCKVTTVRGQHASTSAKLTVLRVPDPPGQPKIKQITSTSLSLTWSPPSFDGHSPITMYLVECKDVSGNRWSTLMNRISEPATIIDDLVSGTEYVFRVLVVNNIGCSSPSIESNIIKMIHSTNNSYSMEPFEDHYTLMDQLASGQYSTVCKSLHKATQQTYIAKLLPLSIGRKHAQHELDILAKLSHPNLVCMSSAYITDKHFILILQYINGLPIFKYFAQKHSPTESDVSTVCRQLGSALQYIHELNIAHLAIKPPNILVIDSSSSSHFVKLIHLSSAKITESSGIKVSSTGNDSYIDYEAPEIHLDEPAQTETDMWSIGVLIYTLLSSTSPFAADTIAGTKRNIKQVMFSFTSDNCRGMSQDIKNLITSLLQRKPSNRMKSKQFILHPWIKACSSTRLLTNVQLLNNL